DGREVEPCGELVAAGLDAHGNVRLVHADTRREPMWANGEPTVFVGGAAREVTDVSIEVPPSSLLGCRIYALALARSILVGAGRQGGYRDLDDCLNQGGVPAMAPPFHVATVTAGGIGMERFDR